MQKKQGNPAVFSHYLCLWNSSDIIHQVDLAFIFPQLPIRFSTCLLSNQFIRSLKSASVCKTNKMFFFCLGYLSNWERRNDRDKSRGGLCATAWLIAKLQGRGGTPAANHPRSTYCLSTGLYWYVDILWLISDVAVTFNIVISLNFGDLNCVPYDWATVTF